MKYIIPFAFAFLIQFSALFAQDVIPGPNSGYTSGSFSVSADGSANYTIPIQVSPGTGGMQPQLALNYNSRQPDGIIGPGWSLSGLSMITRTSHTLAQNGQKREVRFDAKDRLALDGSQLVIRSGDYGENGATYYTEYNSQKLVTSHGTVNGMPEWLEVKTKDGLIMEYGRSSESRVNYQGGNTITHWLLNKISDTKGNYILFTYDKRFADIRPKKIEYTGNTKANLSPYASVEFTYSIRSDSTEMYVFGLRKSRKHLLSKVSCKYDDETVREYNLSYSSPDGLRTSSVLKSVQECGRNNDCHPATTFEWGHEKNFHIAKFGPISLKNVSGDLYGNSNYSYAWDLDFQFCDLNGDGLKDFFTYTRNLHQNGPWGQQFDVEIWLNNGNSANSTKDPYTKIKGTKIFGNARTINLNFGDFNADGRSDMVLQTTQVQFGQPYVLLYEGKSLISREFDTDFFHEFDLVPFKKNGTTRDIAFSSSSNSVVSVSDFSGNGLSDVKIRTGSNVDHILNNDSSGILPFFDDYSVSITSSVYGQFSQYFEIDLNGDGMTDEVVLNPENGLSAINLKDTIKYYGRPEIKTILNPFAEKYVKGGSYSLITGDWNGDGVIDIGFHSRNTGTGGIDFFINTGDFSGTDKGFKALIDNIRGSDIPTGFFSRFVATDFNLDGKTDIIWYNNSAFGGNNVWLVNKGHGKFEFQLNYKNDKNLLDPSYLKGCEFLSLGKFTNSSVLIEALIVNKSKGIYVGNIQFAVENKNIKTITEGDGKKITIDYRYKSQYTNLRNHVVPRYPNYSVDLSPLEVVDNYRVIDASDKTLVDNSYGFFGGVGNMHGRGFRGFEKMLTTDNMTLTWVETTFDLNYLYAGANVKKVITRTRDTKNNTFQVISEVENTLNYKEIGNSYFSYVSGSVSKEYTYGKLLKTVEYLNEFDNYGNATRQTVVYDNGLREIAEHEYFNDTLSWYLGRLTKSTLTRSNANNDLDSRSSEFEYDKNSGMLTKEISATHADESKRLTKSYFFDDFGNVVRSEMYGYNGREYETRTLTSKYDSKGRFEIENKNALGHVSKMKYDDVTGKLTETIEPNGRKTVHEYDNFGREIAIEYHNGNWVQVDYKSCKNAIIQCPDSAHSFVYSQYSNANRSINYYDASNRLILEEGIGPEGKARFKETKYDWASRVWKESLPYKKGDNILWVSNKYDDLNRLVKRKMPNGNEIKYEFDGLKTTTIDEKGRKTTITRDAWDRDVTIWKENGQTISKSYGLFGELAEINIGSSYQQKSTVDEVGSTTETIDPVIGTKTYKTNAFGEVILRVQNAGKDSIRVKYDKLGRVVSEASTEGKTTYNYDPKNAIGELYEVKFSNSHSKTLSYNEDGRVDKETVSIEGESYTIEYKYDNIGRIKEYKYPNGFVLEYNYSKYFQLNSIVDKSTSEVLWQANKYDAKGNLIESEINGGNLVFSKSFDYSTNDLKSLNYEYYGKTNFREDYTYDRFGIIQSVYNSISGSTTSYKYDYFDQLISYKSNATEKTYAYDSWGNITFKSDVGRYNYGTSSKSQFQLASIDLNNGSCLSNYTNQYDFNSKNKLSGAQTDGFDLIIKRGIGSKKIIQALVLDEVEVEKRIYIDKTFELLIKGGETTEINYILSPDGLIAIRTTKSAENPKWNWIIKDRLGSVRGVINSETKNTDYVEYDPWGRIIEGKDVLEKLPFRVGFTGHEHILELGLIDMKGRVYNPLLGRFISPDPFVQFGNYWKSYNRYAYVLNGPTIYTDPSGYFLSSIAKGIGSVVKGVVDVVSGTAKAIGQGLKKVNQWGEKTFGKEIWQTAVIVTASVVTGGLVAGALGPGLMTSILAGAAGGFAGGLTGALVNGVTGSDALKAGLDAAKWGAIGGGLAYGVGSLASGAGSAASAGTVKVLGSGIVQGVISEARGGEFSHGFLAGGAGALGAVLSHGTSPATKVMIGAITGGTAAQLGGGKFANGAMGGFVATLWSLNMQEQAKRESKRARAPAGVEKDKKMYAKLSEAQQLKAGGYETLTGSKVFSKLGAAYAVAGASVEAYFEYQEGDYVGAGLAYGKAALGMGVAAGAMAIGSTAITGAALGVGAGYLVDFMRDYGAEMWQLNHETYKNDPMNNPFYQNSRMINKY